MSKQITPTIIRHPLKAVVDFKRLHLLEADQIVLEGDKPDTVMLSFSFGRVEGTEKILEFQRAINDLIESHLPLPRSVEDHDEEDTTKQEVEF